MTTQPTERLPRGNHRYTKQEVVASQRSRMLNAMADAMVEKGYVGTTVADIIGRAGVSRETFYEQFTSTQHGFEYAFETAADRLFGAFGHMLSGGTPAESPVDRFDRLLGRYLAVIVDEPALARVFLIEVFAGGPTVLERKALTQGLLVDGAASILGVSGPRDHFACEALIAAI
ncbi:MAG: TetR/AcrR family transcriptional regulator, partial [Acidimicrobiales bacterium]